MKGSAIETLIKMKTEAKTDDLLLFLDELIAYEKLSKIEAFKDLGTSEVARKKLPLLSGAYNGELYNMTILEMVRNVMVHMEEPIPNIVQNILTNGKKDLTPKEEKRLKIMQNMTVRVRYCDLVEYDHNTMQKDVAAVFIKEGSPRNAVLIVVKKDKSYTFYQGHYEEDGKPAIKTEVLEPFVYTEGNDRLTIYSYSITGNNAYPFAYFEGKNHYNVMFLTYDVLLLSGPEEQIRVPLDMGERNQLGRAKTNMKELAACLMKIIRKGLNA